MFFSRNLSGYGVPYKPLQHWQSTILAILLPYYIATLLHCYIANPKSDTVALPWEELAGAYRSEHSASLTNVM